MLNGKKLIPCLLGILNCIFGTESVSEMQCPKGCATSTDPDVIQIGNELVKALETINFLEQDAEVFCGDGSRHISYQGNFSGNSWHLSYGAMYNCDIEEYDEDGYDIGTVEEYSFSREFFGQEDGNSPYESHFETTLDHFLETNAFIKYILYDLALVANARETENLEKINHYNREIAQHPESSSLLSQLKSVREQQIKDSREYANCLATIESAKLRIDSMYRSIFDFCINNHKASGSFYCRGMLNFNSGLFLEAFDDISQCIKKIEKKKKRPFPEKAYLYQGILQSEMGKYNEAIETLSSVIRHNPNNEEAFFERACAYFEVGEFDLSLSDYLTIHPSTEKILPQKIDSLSFSLGMSKGILTGGLQASAEFVPSILSSLHGIGHGLWAFAKDPVETSSSFIEATILCVDFIRTHTSQEVFLELVPELKTLAEQWDALSDERRGELSGIVIGKYGLEIFAGNGIIKAMKAYRDLRRANHLMTFQAMAINQENAQLIRLEALRRAQIRKDVLRQGNLKIQWDKQGKHIEGHRNFVVVSNPSRLIHPDPQRLIDNFAGTGIKHRGTVPGAAGYQEIINFGEFIGYDVNPSSGLATPTSWGKIHYAKDGVHIVPRIPRD